MHNNINQARSTLLKQKVCYFNIVGLDDKSRLTPRQTSQKIIGTRQSRDRTAAASEKIPRGRDRLTGLEKFFKELAGSSVFILKQCDQLLQYKVCKFYKSAPKSMQELFYSNIMFFLKKEPKMLPHIWDTFVSKFVGKNFQKQPNLVTLFRSEIE